MPLTRVSPVAPFHFGSTEEFLFGCYHEPPGRQWRNCAILICPPAGHEYINCHRALRQLGARLCDAGFPVMRFDYYGCGDSSGNGDEGTVRRWLEDISSAVCELQRRSGLGQICMIGVRLGATLAMLAGAQRGDLDSLVLWDPVVEGERHLQELLQLQKEMSRFRPKAKSSAKSSEPIEVLGFSIPHVLHTELKQINLLAVAQAPAKNVLVVESYQPASYHRNVENRESCPSEDRLASLDIATLNNHLGRSVSGCEHQRVESPQIWLPAANGSLLVPFQLLQSIVSWACRMHS